MLMDEIPIGVGLIVSVLGHVNFGKCICVLKFKVGALLFQVYDFVKSVYMFFPGQFQYSIVSRTFFMFFSHHRQTWLTLRLLRSMLRV